MKNIIKNIAIILLLLLVASFFVINNQKVATNVSIKPALVTAINTCDGITEKASAHLVAIVAFQQLEIAGRKAAVFKTCMKDRGYKENPKWEKYATPIVNANAKREHISVDESFENLRRIDMKLLSVVNDKPVFWVKR